jgi:hypothetical protein
VSIALCFIVFIENVLSDSPTYLRPLGMVLFATSYIFYKFVMDAEQLNDFQKKQ